MTSAAVASRTRVLVVEYDADACAMYEETLRAVGYDVLTVGTARDAWRSVEERRPDLVVLDRQLPDANGLDLLRRWRETTSMETVPVLVLGSFATEHDVEAASHAGADGFVVKPRSGEALARYVARLLCQGERGKKSAAHRVAPRRALTLVFPNGTPDPTSPSLHEHEGVLHARCQQCLRGSPPLGAHPTEAEQHAIELGWASRGEGWDCPVCIARTETMRQGRPVLRRSSSGALHDDR